MNENREKLHSYAYLFVVTLVFSALATEIFVLYSFVQESHQIPIHPLIVAIVSFPLFSVLGQKISKVDEIGRWILGVSVISSGVYYDIFISSEITNYPLSVLTYSAVAFFFAGLLYLEILERGWKYIIKMKISKKTVIVIATMSIIGVLVIYSVSVYSTTIVSFLDSHPWAMTLVATLITLLGGIFIGRRTKKD